MNWKKGILAAMLLAGSMFTFTGCGSNEREQALAPYVGTWTYEKKINETYTLKETMDIQKDQNNKDVLIGHYKSNGFVKVDNSHTISYDEKDKTVKLDGSEQLLIQKDDKGEYFEGKGIILPNHKYHKQTEK